MERRAGFKPTTYFRKKYVINNLTISAYIKLKEGAYRI